MLKVYTLHSYDSHHLKKLNDYPIFKSKTLAVIPINFWNTTYFSIVNNEFSDGLPSVFKPDLTQQSFLNIIKKFSLCNDYFMAVFYGWFWSVAISLQNKVPEKINMKVGKLKFSFLFQLHT